MLIPVILSGGSGSRLWPQSRAQFPKQFINFNAKYTLFQETLHRLKGIPGLAPPVVIANNDHRFVVAEQLREVGFENAKIILEPCGRNTAPAITVAALHAMKAYGSTAQLLILTADHVIKNRQAFHAAIEKARYAAEQKHLVSFGVTPTCAETGYGYIKRKPFGDKSYAVVEQFVEKPDQATAEQYVVSGEYYWNSGMLLFEAETFTQQMHKYQPQIFRACWHAFEKAKADLTFIRLDEESFSVCPADSVDYALMEKTTAAVMVPLNAGWSDVGSWSSLWEVSDKNSDGNVINGDVITRDTTNTYINSEHKLIATIGVKDLIITESDDAILVTDKACSQQVKEIVKQVKLKKRSEAVTHRKRYLPWGSSDLIDSGEHFRVNHLTIKPYEKLSLHKHSYRTEHWIIVQGTAKIYKDGDVFVLSKNQSVSVNPGKLHRLENPGDKDLKVIEIQSGEYLHDNDIERFDDMYGRECVSAIKSDYVNNELQDITQNE